MKDKVRFYREPQGVYLLVLVGNGKSASGAYDAIGDPFYPGNTERPSLGHATVHPDYLRHRCKKVTWADLPEQWQQAFQDWVEFDLKEAAS